MTLLDPSNLEALNFNEEQSFKSFGTAGTNASQYTSTQSVSLGGTAFEPQDNEDIDSKELSIFGGSITSRADENMDDDTEGAFIENMSAFGLGLTNPKAIRLSDTRIREVCTRCAQGGFGFGIEV